MGSTASGTYEVDAMGRGKVTAPLPQLCPNCGILAPRMSGSARAFWPAHQLGRLLSVSPTLAGTLFPRAEAQAGKIHACECLLRVNDSLLWWQRLGHRCRFPLWAPGMSTVMTLFSKQRRGTHTWPDSHLKKPWAAWRGRESKMLPGNGASQG